jgi:stringent starvation protein B
MLQQDATPSTRPYLIRALYEWCADAGLTPYLAVQVDASTQVPVEHVRDGEIVLNISMDATSGLKLGNEWIEFQARFGGVARQIVVPVDHVIAIYARENGQGMAFPKPVLRDAAQPMVPVHDGGDESLPVIDDGSGEPPQSPPPKPFLRRVK